MMATQTSRLAATAFGVSFGSSSGPRGRVRVFRRMAAGGLSLALVAALSGTAQAQSRTWTGGGTTNNWSDGGNWSGGVAPVNGATLVWDATSTARLSSNNDLNLSIAQLNLTGAPAGVVLSGNALTMNVFGSNGLNSNSSTGRFTINLGLDLQPSSRFLTNAPGAVINGILSGASTELLLDSGNYAFYGANTFSGPVRLGNGGGSLSLIANTLANSGQAQSLGTGTEVRFGSLLANDRGNLYYTGGATSTNKAYKIGGNTNLTGQTGGVFNNGTGALTWTGVHIQATTTSTRTFFLGGFNTDANTWSSGIGDNSESTIALSKTGRGSWTLRQPAIFNPGAANRFTGGLTVNSGRLILDYEDNDTVVASTLAPVLGGGTLEFKAASSGSSAQTLGNVTATAASQPAGGSGLSTIRVNQNGGDGMAVTLGTVTATAGRSAVLYDLFGSAQSSVTIGTSIAADTGTLGTQVIRTSGGAYDFAVNTGANTAVSARNATTVLGVNNGSSTTDFLFADTGDINATFSVATRSLRIAPTQNNQTMTILNTGTYASGGGKGLLVAGGGLLYDGGAHDFTIAAGPGANGASIRVGDNNSAFFVHHYGTGKLTIGERVYLGFAGASPGTAGSNTNIGLFGTGLIDWKGSTNQVGSAATTISGVTARISGTTDALRLDNNTSSTTKGANNIVLNGGGVLEAVNGDITRNVGTGAGAIQWTGDGGFSASGGNRSVNLGGAGAAVTWGGTNFVPSDNALLLSSPYSDSMIDFQNPLALGNLQRVVQVANGSAAVDARLSGVLSSGLTGGLVKEGAGTLELTAANTYFGETWVRAGGLLVAGSVAGSATSVASGAFVGGDGTIGGNLALATGALFAFDAGSTLDLVGALSLDPTFGVNSLVSASGGAVDWANVANSTYTLMNTTFGFNTNTISNFGEANKQTGLAGGKSAYFEQGTGSLQLVVVPEPATLALAACGVGLAGLAAWRRRQA